MLKTLNRWILRLCITVAASALMLMMAVAFIDSIGRQISRPLPGASEIVIFALLIFFYAALPVVVSQDAWIRVGLFSDLYKARLTRIERWFTALAEVAALIAFAWMMYDQANRLDRFGTLSVYFETEMAPWIYAIFLFTLIAVWFALYALREVMVDREARPHLHALPEEEASTSRTLGDDS